jgi:hypothetical protein
MGNTSSSKEKVNRKWLPNSSQKSEVTFEVCPVTSDLSGRECTRIQRCYRGAGEGGAGPVNYSRKKERGRREAGRRDSPIHRNATMPNPLHFFSHVHPTVLPSVFCRLQWGRVGKCCNVDGVVAGSYPSGTIEPGDEGKGKEDSEKLGGWKLT